MKTRRREFLASSAMLAATSESLFAETGPQKQIKTELLRAAAVNSLNLKTLQAPILIESMELLRNGNEYLVRVRSKEGVEAVIVANSSRLRETFPVFLRRVAPFFVGKDARKLEFLLDELYRAGSNYKLQGLAFWVCVAAAEIAVLELLGKISGKSIGEMFGGIVRREIPVYRASGNRGNQPEEELEHLQRLVAETGANAIKFRLGGRMSKTETLYQGAQKH